MVDKSLQFILIPLIKIKYLFQGTEEKATSFQSPHSTNKRRVNMNDYYAWPLPKTNQSIPMIKRIQSYKDRFRFGLEFRYTNGLKPTTMATIHILKHYDNTGQRKPIMVKDVSPFTQ